MIEGQRFGLYYPYLHFSDDWLKIAALYWPQMGRIVPEGIALSDSDTVKALSDELGFVVRVPPGSAVQELTDLLIDIVAEHGEILRERYSISKRYFMMSDSCAPSWPNPQQTFSSLTGSPVPSRGSLPAGSACRVTHGGPALM